MHGRKNIKQTFTFAVYVMNTSIAGGCVILRDFITAAVSITCVVRLLMEISKLCAFLLQKFPACAIKGNVRCDERECGG